MAALSLDHRQVSWRPGGRVRSWWVDPSEGLVVWWRPVVSEFEDEDDQGDPLDILTDKQRFVIELRYGLKDGYEYTQEQVARFMGVGQTMVSSHERAALKKLRKHLLKPPAGNT